MPIIFPKRNSELWLSHFFKCQVQHTMEQSWLPWPQPPCPLLGRVTFENHSPTFPRDLRDVSKGPWKLPPSYTEITKQFRLEDDCAHVIKQSDHR